MSLYEGSSSVGKSVSEPVGEFFCNAKDFLFTTKMNHLVCQTYQICDEVDKFDMFDN